MRSDYGLYVVAVICFIITGIFLTGTIEGYTYTDSMGMAAIAIFLILGAVFALAGYAVRPKTPVSAISTAPQAMPEPSPPPLLPPVEQKVEEPQITQPKPEEQAPPEPAPAVEEVPPAPTPTVEEPAKVEEEKPPTEKRARRPRKKKTNTE